MRLPRATGHTRLDAHERKREEGQPRDGLAVQARKEPIQAMRARASFGDDDVIARDQVDVTWTVQMVPEEDPKQYAPWDDHGEKALDRAITAAFASPPRQAQHRDAPGHDHQCHDDTAQPADRGGSHVRTSTLQQCYNIDHRCAPLWWRSCRLTQRNPTRQWATLPHFWQRYCFKTRCFN